MAETTKSPVFSSPSYWVALTAGVVGIGAAAWSERKGSGSMARTLKITQKRLDEDEALFDRRFGGLVTDENGNNIRLDWDDQDDDAAAHGRLHQLSGLLLLQHHLRNHTLWTHVDGDGGTYLLPGLHRVNRIDYYISVRPWTDADLNTVQIAWTK